ncbi:hypothetical protein ACWGBV_16185, partial [Streptomyces sp. NPDC055051]
MESRNEPRHPTGGATAGGPADAVVVGIDSGGSGLRVALARASDGTVLGREAAAGPVRTGPGGISADRFLAAVLPAVAAL